MEVFQGLDLLIVILLFIERFLKIHEAYGQNGQMPFSPKLSSFVLFFQTN